MSESQSFDEFEEIHEGSAPTPPSAAGQSSLAWLRGFAQIVTQPHRLDALRGANVFKIFAAGSLLVSVSFTLSAWLTFANPTLRSQSLHAMNAYSAAAGQAPLLEMTSFPFTQVLGSSLIQYGLVSIGLMSFMMWLLHRIVSPEPLRMLAFLGICSYASVITSLGYFVSALCANIFGWINAGLSLAPLFSGPDQHVWTELAARFDLFCLWFYGAVGISAASFLGRSLRFGLLLGFAGFAVHLAFSATLSYYSYQMLMNSAH